MQLLIDAHEKDCREEPILASWGYMEDNLKYLNSHKYLIFDIVERLKNTDFVELVLDGVPTNITYKHLREAYHQYLRDPDSVYDYPVIY